MLTRALTRLGDADSPDRARLLASLSVERTWGASFDERLSLAKEGVDVARRTGDGAALVDVIRLCNVSITMPHTLELRRRWNAEACELAAELGDPIARCFVNDYASLAALEAGDATAMWVASAVFETESERIGQPLNRWQVVYHWAWQAMLAGDIGAAEQHATDALDLGTAAGYPDDAGTIYGAQLLGLRGMQGRLREMAPLIESLVRDNPGLHTFRATLASSQALKIPELRRAAGSTRSSPTTFPFSPMPCGWRRTWCGRKPPRAAATAKPQSCCMSASHRGTTSS